MTYEISTSHAPRRLSFLTIASKLWETFSNLLSQRRAHAQLSDLSDRMLMDIGITREDICSVIRHGRPDNQNEKLRR